MISATRAVAADSTIDIAVDRPLARIDRNLYGHFAENLGAVIYGGVWVGPGSPIPNVGGIRKALIDEMRRIKAPIVRFPGGCYADSYEWRDGIGPAHVRPVRTNHWAASLPPNAPDVHRYDPNAFGTGEFMRFCRLTGSEPYLVGNARSLSPSAFAGWVDYCNAPPHATSYGRERAANGDTEPYGVHYWGVGNEAWACGGGFTAAEYAREFRRYTIGLPAHGTPLRLIASGPYKDDYAWTAQLFEGLASRGGALGSVYGLSLHDYTWDLSSGRSADFESGRCDALAFDEAGWYALFREGDRLESLIEGHWDVMAEHDPTHRIKLVVDEWGPWYRDGSAQTAGHLFEQTPTLRDALFTAMTLDTFNRHADKVGMANCSQLINCLNSLYLAHDEHFCVTPVGHVFAMYAAHQGGVALSVAMEAPAASYFRDDEPAQYRGLRGSASLHDRVLVLTVTNPHVSQARETQIALRGARVRDAAATTLASADIHARNTFACPDALVPHERQVPASGSTLAVTFPPASVNKLILTLE